MTRGRGSKKTPERVVTLLTEEVSKSNKAAVANGLGIGVAALHRYLKGIGEPTTATLEKLAKYFGVSVAELRGEELLTDTEYINVSREYRSNEFPAWFVETLAQTAFRMAKCYDGTLNSVLRDLEMIHKLCQVSFDASPVGEEQEQTPD